MWLLWPPELPELPPGGQNRVHTSPLLAIEFETWPLRREVRTCRAGQHTQTTHISPPTTTDETKYQAEMHVLSVSHHDKVEKVVLSPGVSPREVANCLGETASLQKELPESERKHPRSMAISHPFRCLSLTGSGRNSRGHVFESFFVRFAAGRGEGGRRHQAIDLNR